MATNVTLVLAPWSGYVVAGIWTETNVASIASSAWLPGVTIWKSAWFASLLQCRVCKMCEQLLFHCLTHLASLILTGG